MKWSKRSIIFLTAALALIAILGGAAVWVWNSTHPDRGDVAADCTPKGELSIELLSPEDKKATLDVRHTINISAPQGYTRYCHVGDTDAFTLLQPAEWNIRMFTRDGRLCVEGDSPVLHAAEESSRVKTEYSTSWARSRCIKQPDNSIHDTYILDVVCHVIVTPKNRSQKAESMFCQSFRVDVEGGTVDPETPPVNDAKAGTTNKLVTKLPVEGLPTKLSGTPAEVALKGVLFQMGAITSTPAARKAAKELPALMRETLEKHTDPSQPWPQCWGAAEETARSCAQRIQPTIGFLQEQHFFNCQEMAEFINSREFARFFGRDAAGNEPDPLDAPIGDFPIEKVSVEQILSGDDEAQDGQEQVEPASTD